MDNVNFHNEQISQLLKPQLFNGKVGISAHNIL